MTSEPEVTATSPVARAWWRCPVPMFVLHAQRAFFGVAMTWPLARWVAARMNGRRGGDATLFDDGGVLLAETWRQLAPLGRPLISGAAVVALVAFLFGHGALAALLDAMGRPEPVGLRARLGHAAGAVPVLMLLTLAGYALGAAVFGLVWWTGRSVVGSLLTTPVAADVAALGVLGAALAATSWVGILRDLVSAGIAARGLGFVDALELAWKALRRRAVGLWLQQAVRSTTAVVAVAAAGLAAIRIGMRGQREAVAAQLLLEAALVATTCLRASWLGLVVRTTGVPWSVDPTFASALPDEEDSSKNPPAAAPR